MKKIIISLITLTAASAAVNAAVYEYTASTNTFNALPSGGSGYAWSGICKDGEIGIFISGVGAATSSADKLTISTTGSYPFSGAAGFLYYAVDTSNIEGDVEKISFSANYTLSANVTQGAFFATPVFIYGLSDMTREQAPAPTGSSEQEPLGAQTLGLSGASLTGVIATELSDSTSLVKAIGDSGVKNKMIVGVIGFNFDGASVDFSNIKISVTTNSPIPEPSMFGLLAGLGALALVGARRRRKSQKID